VLLRVLGLVHQQSIFGVLKACLKAAHSSSRSAVGLCFLELQSGPQRGVHLQCRALSKGEYSDVQRSVIALDLPVTLGIKRGGAGVCHAKHFYKDLRVLGEGFLSIAQDDAWLWIGKVLRGLLQQYLVIRQPVIWVSMSCAHTICRSTSFICVRFLQGFRARAATCVNFSRSLFSNSGNSFGPNRVFDELLGGASGAPFSFLVRRVLAGSRQSRHIGDGGFKFLRLLHSRRVVVTDVGGIWLSLPERRTLLEEDFLLVVEAHDGNTVLFSDIRDRDVLDEVLTQDGNLLLPIYLIPLDIGGTLSLTAKILDIFCLVRPDDSKH
jgi:hypothetical protein